MLTRYRLAAKATIEAGDERFGLVAVAGPKAGMLVLDALGVLPRVEAPEGEGSEAVLDGGTGARAARRLLRREGLRPDRRARRRSTPRGRGSQRRCRARRRVFGDEASEVLRVEAGVPRFGAEIDEQVMPAEVGVVDRAVSFTKGCYVGQEPVARLHYRGHANRGLRAPARRRVPEAGAAVTVEGRDVGPRDVRRRVADARARARARDRAARGRPGPARRRRHRRRGPRGRARRRARLPLAPLTC